VRAQTPEGLMDIHAGAVILACGGFEASAQQRVRYLGPGWEDVHVRGTLHNTGELLERVAALGAQMGGHLDGAHAVPVDAGSPAVEALVRTVTAYNAAVQDGSFNPAIKDGKRTQGIAPAKTNWSLRLDTPPFVAYSVRCGITFTYGGVLTTPAAEVLRGEGTNIPGL